MRMKSPILATFLLVLLLGMTGLTGCSRRSQTREAQSSQPPATEAVQVTPGIESAMPAPGETVVSAVSPEPLDNASPTQEVPTSQPVIEESPTAEVVAAAEPAAAPTATKVAPPPPTLTTTSSDEGQTVVHKVTAGETLSGIADRYGTTSQAIAVANNISDPSTIIPGTELKIPTSGASLGESSSRESGEGDSSGCRLRHRVKKGEWVWQIARKYGVDPQKVMRANDLTSRKAKTLQPGTILCIP